MNTLLLPYGSYGDILPYIGVGLRLLRRGHKVTLITNGKFHELANQAGLPFHEIGSGEDYEKVASLIDDHQPYKAASIMVREVILPLMRIQFEAVRSLTTADTILVGSRLGLGAWLAHEALRIPFIMLHLQPVAFWSVYKSPKFGRRTLLQDWAPICLKNFQYRAITWLMWDRHLLEPMNRFRAELGLLPVTTIREIEQATERTIAMFPDWFAPKQPDWPSQTVHTGFPLWDEWGDRNPCPAPLDEFIGCDIAPLVFMPGSFFSKANNFFKTAIDASLRLGMRAILLTRYPEQLPNNLPKHVRHFDYAPFSAILPRCRALISHGGIGTISAGLAAGIPQLVMPIFSDQFDNADRLKHLGTGDFLYPEKFNADRVSSKIKSLVFSDSIRQRCQELARKIRIQDSIETTCDLIEVESNKFKSASITGRAQKYA